MFGKLKSMIKNERGLTLIELLAVVVILGIIAAIAIPAIGGIIDNTRKDAHVANAQQMISSAKIAVTGDNELDPRAGGNGTISLADLEDGGLIETLEDPDGESYNRDDSNVVVAEGANENQLTYTVTLIGSERTITEVLETDLSRDSVNDN